MAVQWHFKSDCVFFTFRGTGRMDFNGALFDHELADIHARNLANLCLVYSRRRERLAPMPTKIPSSAFPEMKLFFAVHNLHSENIHYAYFLIADSW